MVTNKKVILFILNIFIGTFILILFNAITCIALNDMNFRFSFIQSLIIINIIDIFTLIYAKTFNGLLSKEK